MRGFLCLMGVVFLVIVIQEQVPMNTVYACSDKEKNPPDVQVHCKQLTRGQWWAK
jgi:hypothetical protein